jgi:hypothetical protein
MFGLFEATIFRDEQLGEFRRRGRLWFGNLTLPTCGEFRLVLTGNHQAPDTIVIGIARELPNRFSSLKPDIENGLFEHYTPYKDAIDAGLETRSPCPNVANPAAVWQYATPAHILIEPPGNIVDVEIAFRVAWDVEHTLGARFRDWHFVELNGSV